MTWNKRWQQIYFEKKKKKKIVDFTGLDLKTHLAFAQRTTGRCDVHPVITVLEVENNVKNMTAFIIFYSIWDHFRNKTININYHNIKII